MHSNESCQSPGRRLLSLCTDPPVLGTILGVGSAVGYTAANICLRAVADCDAIWVSCVKAFPTVALVLPWLLCRAVQSQAIVSSPRLLGLLAAAALCGQLGGNVLFQWSLGVVGIALSVPLTLGTMIISGTMMGRRVLGEHVSPRMTMAIVILVAAIFVLGFGARAANQSIAHPSVDGMSSGDILHLAAGVAAACLSGLAYCVLGGALRYTASRGLPQSTILMTVGVIGLLSLGGLSSLRMGPAAMWNTDSANLAMMLMAGICNATAFWALTKALQLTGLVYVQALNASQTAMAAIAGVLLFSEAPSIPMVIGVVLTMAGLLLMRNDGGEAKPVVAASDPDPVDLTLSEVAIPAPVDATVE